MRHPDVADDICGSRGPRIGEDQPVCKEPRYHETRHVPGEDDGWGDLTWSDHAICGRTNMEQRADTGINERAERVRRFLFARSAMGGVHPDTVYTVGDPATGDLLDLRVGDLAALVRAVLGDDAQTVDKERQSRMYEGSASAAAWRTKALRDGAR